MLWRKLGLVYAPSGERWWAHAYATIPTVEIVGDQVIRVYFAALDSNLFGRIGYVDLDADDPTHILFETPEPILDLGELGTFDDSGVNPSCVLTIASKKYLYYIGWQRSERVPYMLFAGLACSDDGTHFERISRVPILDRTDAEPFSRSAPYVMVEDGVFKMWYWSCVAWSAAGHSAHYNNVIRHATSTDGIHWKSHDQICIRPEKLDEYSVGRPWVIRDGSLYKMWYSIRSHNKLYRIGYAESSDGLSWIRKDSEAGIVVSASGWDSEMICYPCVVDVRRKRYMFYNGNRHGMAGFGFALLES